MSFDEDMNLFFDDFADESFLNRPGQKRVRVNVIFDRSVEVIEDTGIVSERRDAITFRKDEIPDAWSILSSDDTVNIGTNTYRLLIPMYEDDQIVTWFVR